MSSFWAILCSILTLYVYSGSVSANTCWFYCSNPAHHLEYVLHYNNQQEKPQIKEGWCATSTGKDTPYTYYAGLCPFRHEINNTNRMYSELPRDPDQLNVQCVVLTIEEVCCVEGVLMDMVPQ